MAKTQLELLKEVNGIYREIGEMTERLLHEDPHEQLELIEKRGEHIASCHKSLEQLSSLPPGGSTEEIEAEKVRLNEQIVSTVAHDKILSETLSESMSSIQKDLKETVPKRRVLGHYELHSRKER